MYDQVLQQEINFVANGNIAGTNPSWSTGIGTAIVPIESMYVPEKAIVGFPGLQYKSTVL